MNILETGRIPKQYIDQPDTGFVIPPSRRLTTGAVANDNLRFRQMREIPPPALNGRHRREGLVRDSGAIALEDNDGNVHFIPVQMDLFAAQHRAERIIDWPRYSQMGREIIEATMRAKDISDPEERARFLQPLRQKYAVIRWLGERPMSADIIQGCYTFGRSAAQHPELLLEDDERYQLDIFGAMVLSETVRQRGEVFEEVILEFAKERLAKGHKMTAVDVAGGSCNYGSRAMERLMYLYGNIVTPEQLQFYVADISRTALENAAELAKERNVEHLFKTKRANILNKRAFFSKGNVWGQGLVTDIYSAGFTDYDFRLKDPILHRDDKSELGRVARLALPLGGHYLNANITDFPTIVGTTVSELDVMQYVLNFNPLVGVTAEEFVLAHLQAGWHPQELRVHKTPINTVTIIEARKLTEEPFDIDTAGIRLVK